MASDIFPVVSSLVGVAIGGVISYFGMLSIEKRKETNKNIEEIYAPLYNEITGNIYKINAYKEASFNEWNKLITNHKIYKVSPQSFEKKLSYYYVGLENFNRTRRILFEQTSKWLTEKLKIHNTKGREGFIKNYLESLSIQLLFRNHSQEDMGFLNQNFKEFTSFIKKKYKNSYEMENILSKEIDVIPLVKHEKTRWANMMKDTQDIQEDLRKKIGLKKDKFFMIDNSPFSKIRIWLYNRKNKPKKV